jgi:threonine/homoserine/homoserine lactone efflux protein
MPSINGFVTFAVTAFVLIVIPGPSVLFTIGRALTLGRGGAMLSVLGNTSGCFLQVLAVAFGVGPLVERSSEVYYTVKYVGAAYLVYLGVQAFRHRRSMTDALGTDAPPRSTRRQYLDGLLVGVTNPKTIVFFSVVMPQFADRGAGHLPLQLILLGAVFPLIALVSDTAWALLAGSARTWLARSPRRLASVGGAGGIAIVGLGVTVAAAGRPD